LVTKLTLSDVTKLTRDPSAAARVDPAGKLAADVATG
jgi:hypothetical protein